MGLCISRLIECLDEPSTYQYMEPLLSEDEYTEYGKPDIVHSKK